MQMLTKITNNICDTALLRAKEIYIEDAADSIARIKVLRDDLQSYAESRTLTKTAKDRVQETINHLNSYINSDVTL